MRKFLYVLGVLISICSLVSPVIVTLYALHFYFDEVFSNGLLGMFLYFFITIISIMIGTALVYYNDPDMRRG